jgi:hypothetical protein
VVRPGMSKFVCEEGLERAAWGKLSVDSATPRSVNHGEGSGGRLPVVGSVTAVRLSSILVSRCRGVADTC